MTTWVMDAEWKVPEGEDIVLGAQKIHCACFKELQKDNWCNFVHSNDKYKVDNPMEAHNLHCLGKWFSRVSSGDTFIGHNILNADLEVFRRLLGVDFTVGPDTIQGVPCNFIDTLTLSRRLNPDREHVEFKGKKLSPHGLAAWSRRCGSQKIEVLDWSSQPIEVYLERCRGDALDNEKVYLKLLEEMR